MANFGVGETSVSNSVAGTRVRMSRSAVQGSAALVQLHSELSSRVPKANAGEFTSTKEMV